MWRAAPAAGRAAANLAAAGVPERIGKALFDAGTPARTITAPCDAELYVALTSESAQADQDHHGTAQPSWQVMAARVDTPEGRTVYKGDRRAGLSPSCSPASAGPCTYRGEMVDTKIYLWAAVHNMLKAIRAHGEQRERQATAPIPPWQPHNRMPGGSRTRQTWVRDRQLGKPAATMAPPTRVDRNQNPAHVGIPGPNRLLRLCDSLHNEAGRP